MDEVTEGGGTKALRLTSNRIFARSASRASTDKPAIMLRCPAWR